MWKGKENLTYAFTVLEMPSDVEGKRFNEEKFRKDFHGVIDVRRVPDRSSGVAATVFLEIETADILDLDPIMSLDMHNYVQ